VDNPFDGGINAKAFTKNDVLFMAQVALRRTMVYNIRRRCEWETAVCYSQRQRTSPRRPAEQWRCGAVERP